FAPRFPSLWQRFCQFYRQDPSQRLRVHSTEGDYGKASEH
ncbi:DgsA anti-repressor MtfA, partial [Salmonella enterica]|nr:DgsA anti-repressor MtfA [Salmonella enterica]